MIKEVNFIVGENEYTCIVMELSLENKKNSLG